MKPRSPDASKSSSFSGNVRRGTRFVFVAQIASQITSLIVIATLYRLVDPEDFGLIGMLAPWVMLLRMVTTQGLGVATIQQPELSNTQINAVYWLNLLLGFGSALLIGVSSFGLARLYAAPPITLLGLAFAPTAILAAAANTHQALLERKLQFHRVTSLRLSGQVAGGIFAIATALLCQRQGVSGVWALVVQQYVEFAWLVIAGWLLEDWRPQWIGNVKRSSDLTLEMRALLKFGGFYGTANLVFFFGRNIDKIALSILFGSTPGGRIVIGMYSQAFNQMMKPVQLVATPITSVLLPILSRTQFDHTAYQQYVVRFYRLAMLGLAPCSIGLWVVAEDAFLLLGGSEWKLAGVYLTLLAPIIAAQGMIDLCGSVLASRGYPRLLFFGAIALASSLLLTVAGTTICLQWYEIEAEAAAKWMAIACSLTVVFVMPFYVAACMKAGEVSRRQLLLATLSPLAIAIWMGLVTWTMREILVRTSLPLVLRLAAVITTGALFYCWIARDLIGDSYRELLSAKQAPRDQLETDEPT